MCHVAGDSGHHQGHFPLTGQAGVDSVKTAQETPQQVVYDHSFNLHLNYLWGLLELKYAHPSL